MVSVRLELIFPLFKTKLHKKGSIRRYNVGIQILCKNAALLLLTLLLVQGFSFLQSVFFIDLYWTDTQGDGIDFVWTDYTFGIV